MHWWEEAEARALRARSAAGLAETVARRLEDVGLDSDTSFAAAYDIASLHYLCLDLVRLVEAFLTVRDGDRAGMRRTALLLGRWTQAALFWTRNTAPAFNRMLDGLDLDADLLAGRQEADLEVAEESPEEVAKQDGRYQHWHLLYERLDLKLESIAVEDHIRRNLARNLARIYEQCLVTIRFVNRIAKQSGQRWAEVVRLLLEINTVWHFDLGPYYLGYGELRAQHQAAPGLQTWLLLAFYR